MLPNRHRVTLFFPSAMLPQSLDVLEFSFHDAFNQLFEGHFLVQSTEPDLSVYSFVGERAILELNQDGWGPIERITGIVREARQESAEVQGVSRFRLSLVPHLWVCSKRINYRIFQDMNVFQILRAIREDYGGRIPEFEYRLREADYPVRTYCTQYNESDLDFMFRLLAEEGIATFFCHEEFSRWVLVDDTSAQTPELPERIPYWTAPSPGALPEHIAVVAVRMGAEMNSTAVEVRKYDPDRPLLAIQARAEPPQWQLFYDEKGMEVYELGSVHLAPSTAPQQAQRRLDALRAPVRQFEVDTNFALGVGRRFSIADLPRTVPPLPFLVTETTLTGDTHLCRVHLNCMFAEEQLYRPPQRPRPQLIGPHTAFVVSSDGTQEIDVDEQGRVLVEFRWDRRALGAHSSRRVRVSQGWAGPNYGFVCLPRVGDEVVVTFVNGDPDDPLIVGRVHNPVNPIPLSLPEEKTVSVWRSKSSPGGQGANQILLDDLAGNERMEIHAQRDYRVGVGHDSFTVVGNDQTQIVRGNTETSVLGDSSTSSRNESLSTGQYKVSATKVEISASGEVEIKAGTDRKDMSATHLIQTGKLTCLADDSIEMATHRVLIVAFEIELTAGGSTIKLTQDGIEIKSSGLISIHSSDDVDVKGSMIYLNS